MYVYCIIFFAYKTVCMSKRLTHLILKNFKIYITFAGLK